MGTTKRNIIITYRLAAAGAAWVAVCAQLARQMVSGNSAVNFLSYFTIQSNVLAVVVLALGAGLLASGHKKLSPSFEAWRGATTLYLVVTGIVYALLLSNLPNGPGDLAPWVDDILHRALPLVIAFDWLFDRPAIKISRKTALFWLAYPIICLVYSLIRGPIVKWYPYPFLNPSHGYLKVILTSVVIAVAGALLALLIGAWPRPLRGQLEVDSTSKTIKD
jgi:hypothetical protein